MKKFLVLILTVIIVMGTFSGTASAMRISDYFDDVSEGMWYAVSIKSVVAKGLMNGVTDRKFEPQSPITRGMLTTIIYRIHGEPEAGSCNFEDVAKGSYYEKPIAWASECGITNGVTATKFDPDASITREQLVTILYRYCIYIGLDMNDRYQNKPITDYKDYKTISGYAVDAIKWATDMTLIIGDNGNFDPKGVATRAHASSILNNFDNMLRNR
ncbi:MAG: S-layer homology domain-containing protein [Clostridia bacterium]|nr:S-layer homology domain-containing protein [Clostridia bacterium]